MPFCVDCRKKATNKRIINLANKLCNDRIMASNNNNNVINNKNTNTSNDGMNEYFVQAAHSHSNLNVSNMRNKDGSQTNISRVKQAECM